MFCFCRNATISSSSGIVWNTTLSPPTGWLSAPLWSSRCCHCPALSPSLEVCVRTRTGRFSRGFVRPSKTNIFSASVGYHAPLDLYPEFHRIAKDPGLHSVPEGRPVSVCVGKEWYRFPSSFLLPHKCVSRAPSDTHFHSFPANRRVSFSPAGSCTSFSRNLKGSCRSRTHPVRWPCRSSQPT